MDESLGYFGVWLLIFLGLLWVKRQTGLLRCNVFSAAIVPSSTWQFLLVFTI
ncbi:MAG: hypothetical protein HC820_04980 [Hydrococcus sp. RM1_1_31]|nr:hypothetical protein [Hydrococcus sp. RM1_1_31]